MNPATLAAARASYCALFASRPTKAVRRHHLTLAPGHVAAYCQPFSAQRVAVAAWVYVRELLS